MSDCANVSDDVMQQEKTRRIHWKDASNCAKQLPRDAQSAQGKSLRACSGGGTHDWALDLEPLALPPDLPPVILVMWVGG
jgi:hypothetical protein